MFKSTQQYVYGLNEQAMFNDETVTGEVNLEDLRQIWVRQILNEQNEFDKAYAKRHPMSAALMNHVFFAA